VLLSPSGLPCNPPPWGTLTAVDLDDGSQAWQRPLGFFPMDRRGEAATMGTDAGARGEGGSGQPGEQWGSVNLGGVLVTGGSLAFVAATRDAYLRAIDVDTGVDRWRHQLPAGGHALPMTYRYGGRQYVVIAAGGHPRMDAPASDHVVAFALDGGAAAAGAGAATQPDPSWAGTYAGEFRGDRRRYDMEMRVEEAVDGGLTAAVSLRDPHASGTWRASRERDGASAGLRWTGTLAVEAMTCSASFDVPAALANRGRDMIGDGTVHGTCTEGRVETASFSLRRRR
jgi:outer membrane protein assembly factor BamB